MATKNFDQAILNSARSYAGGITTRAKGFSQSARIRRTIRSRVSQENGRIVVTTTAGDGNTEPGGTGDARAREYGSGLHAVVGVGKKYPIRPRKSGGLLVFAWDVATVGVHRTKEGKAVLKEVMHPGIRADNNGKGYIRPARIAASKVLRKNLKEKGAKGIRLDLRSSFKGATVR